MSVQDLAGLVKRLETVTQRLEAVSTVNKPALAPKPGSRSTPPPTVVTSAPPPSVLQYDDAVEDSVRNFLSSTEKLGGDVAAIGPKLKSLFENHRNFLWYAAGVPKPDDKTTQSKVEPMVNLINEITSFKDSKRNTPMFNHLSTVSEALGSFYWIGVSPTPGPHIKEMIDASMFYVNRVRKDHKGEAAHEDWLKNWLEIFNNLQKYVRQVHTTGLVYNSSPGSAPPAGASTPSPAPPKGPGDLFDDVKKGASSAEKDARAALFADLNKGEGITSGLKKVTADMQTHKNPNLRAANTVPAAASGTSGAGTGNKPATVTQKPPRTELENFKNWAVEYHKDNRNISIEITDMKQTVYIFKCENSVIQLKGKVNSITIDGCKKTSVAFENLLGQVEVINSQSIEIQTLGKMPTVSIQKTDGCQVYLSKESINAEIVTSKSSEMNVLVPKDDGDFAEFPIPEQFKTMFNQKSNKLQTTVSDII
ncbi:hypothetical protein FO519_005645 [Halicephalobus sp. NKZ332]|nr:hypothetical protein FO519_005645 [Halicephalobus sp. NKZ332]